MGASSDPSLIIGICGVATTQNSGDYEACYIAARGPKSERESHDFATGYNWVFSYIIEKKIKCVMDKIQREVNSDLNKLTVDDCCLSLVHGRVSGASN